MLDLLKNIFFGSKIIKATTETTIVWQAFDTTKEVELVHSYGLKTFPDERHITSALILSEAGNIANAIAIAAIDKNIKQLNKGEVLIYSTHGQKILLKDDGTIRILGDTFITGTLTISGDVIDKNGSMQEMRNIYNGHKHTQGAGDHYGGGGTTTPPEEAMT